MTAAVHRKADIPGKALVGKGNKSKKHYSNLMNQLKAFVGKSKWNEGL